VSLLKCAGVSLDLANENQQSSPVSLHPTASGLMLYFRANLDL
jgi:hypothetical protein